MSTAAKRPSLAEIVAQRKAESATATRSRNRVKRQNRYERWHVPETLEREQDGWLTTYMDLITLLLVLFIAMMALSRIDVRPAAGKLPPDLVGSLKIERLPPAALADAMPEMPVIPAAWADLPESAASGAALAHATASAAGHEAPLPAPGGTTPPTDAPAATPAERADVAGAAAATPTVPAIVPPTAEELGLTDLGEDVDVIINSQSVSFRISNELLFPSGQALLNPVGQDVIGKLAAVINRSDHPVSVEGHSDPVPIQTRQFPSNWELSSSRATAVLRGLVQAGVDPGRLRAVGYADTQPLQGNDSAEGRAANRRVELIMRIVPANAQQSGSAAEGAPPPAAPDQSRNDSMRDSPA